MGGMTAALALQQAGVRVSVYEQAPRLGEVGAGLTLAPNATRVYQHLGIIDALNELGVQPHYAAVKHYQTGEELVNRERRDSLFKKYGAPYIQIHRADLHDVLAGQVRANDADCVHLGHAFTGFKQNGTGVVAHFANGAAVEADVLIGADGVRSEVRGQMFEPGPPTFSGHVAWRGLVPVQNLAELPVPDSSVSIGPKRLFTRYYVRRREMVNVVAFARKDGWEIESWSEHADMNELMEVFAGWNDEVQTLLRAMPRELCFKWALMGRAPLDSWVQGRVALLGDAAHPMLPFLGMGAASAIEDGLVLARALAESADAESGLQRYDAARRPRGNYIMAESQKRVAQLQGDHPESYSSDSERNEESLGLFEYDAGTVAV
jgi:salicylate hydroxylase